MPLKVEVPPKIVAVGVDPGTSKGSPLTATVVTEIGKEPASTFQDFVNPGKEVLPYKRLVPLYASFRKWLGALQVNNRDVVVFVIEEPLSVQNGNTTIVLAQINILVQMACVQKLELLPSASIITCSPGTWKKQVLGKGNFKKEMILKEVYKKWNIDFSSDDMADSYCLGVYGHLIKGGDA